VLRAVATDTNNIESITERVIEVAERIGEIPSGMVSMYPSSYNRVARGSKLMAVPKFYDSDGSIARVEFYLNGKIIHIDDAEPFYCIFSPESRDDISTIERRWELTMVGIDNDDNRISIPASGVVAGAVIMPNFQITQPLTASTTVDGEEIDIIIEATDSSNAHLGFNPNPIAATSGEVKLYANGQLIGTVNELGTGSGHFSFKWAVNEALATFDQKVDIVAVSTMNGYTIGGTGGTITPALVSDPVTIEVKTRDPINDPQAAVVQTYNDILLYNPTEEEVAASLEEILDGTISHSQWTSNLTQRGAFQDIVDAVASYYITVGDWPSFLEVRDALLTYSLKPDNKTPDLDLDGYSASQETKYGTMDDDAASFPSHEFRVLDYIDDLFRSTQFVRKHGALKKTQGTSSTEDLELNRRDFVSMLIKNMTNGVEATLQQRIQGSYRMQGFDPSSSASQQEQLQQQMMQMAMMGGGFGFGGGGNSGRGGRGNNNNNNNNNNQFFNQLFNNNNNNNNTQNSQYKSGISPVVFTGYLVTEDKIENLDLVWGVPSMRNTFHTAALMLALWQDKQAQIDWAEINQLSSLGDAGRVEKMLDDYRYRTRFAYVWNEAETPNADVPDWKYLDWFGYFNYKNHPWTFHKEHGWIYMGSSSDENIWFYDAAIGGWLWTSKTVYPYIHDATRDSWMYYEKGTAPRQFYDFHKGAWEIR
jgi:hypothetical protein